MSTISPKAAKLEAALMLHHQAGRLSEAERLYRRILRDRPSHPGTNTALGIALKDQGKLDEAAAAFQRVIAVAPDQAPGLLGICGRRTVPAPGPLVRRSLPNWRAAAIGKVRHTSALFASRA